MTSFREKLASRRTNERSNAICTIEGEFIGSTSKKRNKSEETEQTDQISDHIIPH